MAKKRQYEQFTDADGNPCRVSDDSLMAGLYQLMPTSLEDVVMFKSDEFATFDALFDRLSSFANTRHSLQLSKRDIGTKPAKKDPDAMDIGAVSKGKKGKGKGGGSNQGKGITCHNCGKLGHKASECRSKGFGKSGKSGKDKKMDNVQCWVCYGYGHYGKDCKSAKGGKGAGKGKDGGKKGKDGKNLSSVEPNAQPEKEPELSHLDLCPLDADGSPRLTPSYGPSGAPSERSRGVRVDASRSRTRSLIPPEGPARAHLRSLGTDEEDLSGASTRMRESHRPAYVEVRNGEEWIRMNYDSGAVSTVIPVEFAGS